ncbi:MULTISPECIES: 30S ribosomal protein S4 [Hornefia]|jgi:small subunit ribosomal protein S4|uniref:Small ribosomal subunit protein uS4 n=2 Tax=Hornefia TaxID=2815774 RepID=A0A1Q9JHK2_9FIRM|nr:MULTISPECIES: 30S ribosomal protein S4 [Hornefia]MCI7327708.1 30S ribosomal protein S4 [Clostridiales bacterium]MCI7412478.1 30S ribosomal protein S4 [Clostridiales bacterium]MCI7680302.1 30S ribosomal protein S4 [Clostridiales bacterium]MDD6299983.1 30S ribosomal protein S4 [Hornefia butyriciproducens]MDD7019181.1 30S ribosomal protein S4 [Hornefia butyriciproducens]
MARYTAANCRLCRREGQKLFLKGDRCYGAKCALERKNYAPGQHGQGRKKTSEYGLQLREKQKAKRFYGLQETQFRNLFEKAASRKGVTGDNLLILLESRLDNVVYRLGLASSRKEARQLIVHSHFTLNGKKVNSPGLEVKAGDVIKVKEKSQSSPKFKEIKDMQITVPSWLTVDTEKLEGKVVALPTRADIDTPIAEHLIVELYSK